METISMFWFWFIEFWFSMPHGKITFNKISYVLFMRSYTYMGLCCHQILFYPCSLLNLHFKLEIVRYCKWEIWNAISLNTCWFDLVSLDYEINTRCMGKHCTIYVCALGILALFISLCNRRCMYCGLSLVTLFFTYC